MECIFESDPTPKYSHLAVSLGLIADVDLESEFIRFIGDLRYHLWGLWRWIKTRYYMCNYTIKEYDEENQTFKKTTIDSTNLLLISLNKSAYLHRDICIVPQCQSDDGLWHLITVDNRVGSIGAVKLLLNMEDSVFFKKIEGESDENLIEYEERDIVPFNYSKVKEFELQIDEDFVRRCKDPAQNINYGHITIDGEWYPTENISCKLIPKAIEIFW